MSELLYGLWHDKQGWNGDIYSNYVAAYTKGLAEREANEEWKVQPLAVELPAYLRLAAVGWLARLLKNHNIPIPPDVDAVLAEAAATCKETDDAE